MADISLFPSGLSNWSGSDKPKREHFVSDNRTLDENAMWKADYDQNGNIAAVGIEEYVTTQIDTAIGNYASSNTSSNGFVTYLHSKAGNSHELEPELNEGDIIKFVATDDFNKGDNFFIDNNPIGAITTDGEPLMEGAFKEDSVVTCFKTANTLIFNVSSIPVSNGEMTGSIKACNYNRPGCELRSIEIYDGANNSPVSTNSIRFVR